MICCDYCKFWNKNKNALFVGFCEKLKIITVNHNYCEYFKPSKRYHENQEDYLSII